MIGMGLCVFAACGLALGWLGTWGLLLWVPLLVLGFLFVGLIGHFLLFLLPILVIQELLTLWCKQK